jgi:hypothetical protein
MSVTHDFSAIEALEREFENKRQEELRATVERDMSPLRAQEKEANGRAEAQVLKAQADRRQKTGYAALAAGLGIGAAAFGLSFVLPPKIVETTKVVTETKTVEVPKIVEVPKVVETTKVVEVPKLVEHTKVIEVPKIVEKTMPAPPAPTVTPPTPAPKLGEHSTVENFTGSEDYKNTVFRGKIVSHANGEIRFDNGQSFLDAFPDGSRDFAVNNKRHDGDYAYCAQNGSKFPNGTASFYCYALHNGVVERTSLGSDKSSSGLPSFPPTPRANPGRQSDPNDPFADLFDLPE